MIDIKSRFNVRHLLRAVRDEATEGELRKGQSTRFRIGVWQAQLSVSGTGFTTSSLVGNGEPATAMLRVFDLIHKCECAVFHRNDAIAASVAK